METVGNKNGQLPPHNCSLDIFILDNYPPPPTPQEKLASRHLPPPSIIAPRDSYPQIIAHKQLPQQNSPWTISAWIIFPRITTLQRIASPSPNCSLSIAPNKSFKQNTSQVFHKKYFFILSKFELTLCSA